MPDQTPAQPEPTTDEAAKAFAQAIANGTGAIICYTRCWSCMFSQCYNPPQPHPWWDAEDVEHAASTGQQPPSGNCACNCAKPVGAAS